MGDRPPNKALLVAAIGEGVTGLALVLTPSLVGRLLLGDPLDGAASVAARVAGFALIGLGAACWPGPAILGMLVYSGTVAVYLAYLGVFTAFAGLLLWPSVALHVVLAAALFRSYRKHFATSS